MHVYPLKPSLPWDIFPDEQQRLRKIIATSLIGTLLFSILFTVLPQIAKEKRDTVVVPKHVVKMVLEKKKVVPPPPKPLPVPEKKEEPKVVEPPKPKPPEPKPEVKKTPKPVEKAPPKPAAKPKPTAKQQAQNAFQDVFGSSLNDLQDNKVVSSLDKKSLSNAGNRAGTTERSMVTSNAGRASSGINDANLSRGTGGSGSLSGVAGTSKVASSISRGGAAAGAAASSATKGSGRKSKRSEEEIQIVFDRNRGSFDSLYARALRTDPTLEGKVVFRLTISASGAVTKASIVSSELGDKTLERKLVLRVKRLKFKAGNKATTTINYPIDFFPS